MTFYVIGNGFDIHYGLDTRYSSFKKYLRNVAGDVVDRVDDLFERYNMSRNPENIKEWNTLEDMLAVFCLIDGDEIYDEALSNAETDDERADYWDSPSWNVGYYTEYIDVLKEEFVNWIVGMDVRILLDSYFLPQNDDYILTFNYTETVEANFDIRNVNILHIHGKVGDELILGHNDYQNPVLYNINWDEDTDFRSGKAMDAVDDVLTSAAELYFKDSESILKKNIDFFEKINKRDRVVFLGLSCGEQDNIYVEEIIRRAKNIDFFWHDEDTLNRFYNICDKIGTGIDICDYKW